jgi:tetratricopeptide (TPR) repeat protein
MSLPQTPVQSTMPMPAKIGKYVVLDRLGGGAFGVVYRCRDPDLDREVAVKVLLAADHAQSEAIERFQREARLAARLSHPHIVPVFDAGFESGRPYLVMELIPGQTLDQLLSRQRLPLMTALQIVYHVAQALQAAHEQNVVHRDVKPANVLIDTLGRPKLTDFGLARLADDARWLSQSGDLLGTPRYMSPEQALLPSEEIDHRADIYSLGAILFELLSGKPIVDASTPLATLRQLTDGEQVALEQVAPHVAPELAAICNKMVARDRNDRFDSASDVMAAIRQHIVQATLGTPEVELLAGLPAPSGSHRQVAAAAKPPVVTRRMHPAAIIGGVVSLVALAAIVVAVFRSRGGTLDAARSDVVGPTNIDPKSIADLRAIDLSQLQIRLDQQIPQLIETTDDERYRKQLQELLDEVNAAIKQHPTDSKLRLRRGELLHRAGEYVAAANDFEQVSDPALQAIALRKRVLVRGEWEYIYLHAIVEPALRPNPTAALKRDLESLKNTSKKTFDSGMVANGLWLSKLPLPPPPTRLSDPPMGLSLEERAHWWAWQSVVFIRSARQLHEQWKIAEAGSEPREKLQAERDRCEALAGESIRNGLEADPHHLGLLFLRSETWQQRLRREAEDQQSGLSSSSHRPAFENAFRRFRTLPLRDGMEVAVGRALLLGNVGRYQQAQEQLTDAAGDRSPLAPVAAIHFWYQLVDPPDGEISPLLVSQVISQTDAHVAQMPDQFGIFFVRAIARAAAGDWQGSRRELQEGRRHVPANAWPHCSEPYKSWCQYCVDSPIRFQEETVEVLWRLSTPAWARINLQEAALKQLTDSENLQAEEIDDEERNERIAWAHYRLAKMYAEQEDRGTVLLHVRKSLEAKLPDLTASAFQDDEVIGNWNDDEAFVAMYAEVASEPSDGSESEAEAGSESEVVSGQ